MQKLRLAVLIDDGFPELDLWYPIFRMREEDADPRVLGADGERAYGSRLGYAVQPDAAIADVSPADFDAIVVPGGEAGARIAANADLVRFIAEAAKAGAMIGCVSDAGAAAAAGLLPAGTAMEPTGLTIAGAVLAAASADDLPDLMKAFADMQERAAAAARH